MTFKPSMRIVPLPGAPKPERVERPLPSVVKQMTNAISAAIQLGKSVASGAPAEVSAEEAARRLAICRACENYRPSDDRCALCACFMGFAARLYSKHCPATPPKW